MKLYENNNGGNYFVAVCEHRVLKSINVGFTPSACHYFCIFFRFSRFLFFFIDFIKMYQRRVTQNLFVMLFEKTLKLVTHENRKNSRKKLKKSIFFQFSRSVTKRREISYQSRSETRFSVFSKNNVNFFAFLEVR